MVNTAQNEEQDDEDNLLRGSQFTRDCSQQDGGGATGEYTRLELELKASLDPATSESRSINVFGVLLKIYLSLRYIIIVIGLRMMRIGISLGL